MLANATIAKLEALGLNAMAATLAEQLGRPGPWAELCFEDRLGLLVDREADARESRRLATRLKAAKLRYPAAVEDLDLRAPRGLDRATVLSLAQASWVAHHHILVITGPTEAGKSFLACALANAALRHGHSAYYVRTPRLLDELAIGRVDGRYARLLGQLGRVGLLVLDDFLLTPAPIDACATCSTSSKTAPNGVPPWSPPRSPSTTGTPPWPTRPWPRPSWTVSCRPRTASPSPAPRCAAANPTRPPDEHTNA